MVSLNQPPKGSSFFQSFLMNGSNLLNSCLHTKKASSLSISTTQPLVCTQPITNSPKVALRYYEGEY